MFLIFEITMYKINIRAFLVNAGGSAVKNLPDNAGDEGDTGLIPGFGRSPGEGNGHPVQCSCLENSWTGEPGRL